MQRRKQVRKWISCVPTKWPIIILDWAHRHRGVTHSRIPCDIAAESLVSHQLSLTLHNLTAQAVTQSNVTYKDFPVKLNDVEVSITGTRWLTRQDEKNNTITGCILLFVDTFCHFNAIKVSFCTSGDTLPPWHFSTSGDFEWSFKRNHFFPCKKDKTAN